MINPNRNYRSKEIAYLLGISEGTLRNWRVQGRGPKFVKQKGPRGKNGYLAYPGQSLLNHTSENLRSSTSDQGGTR